MLRARACFCRNRFAWTSARLLPESEKHVQKHLSPDDFNCSSTNPCDQDYTYHKCEGGLVRRQDIETVRVSVACFLPKGVPCSDGTQIQPNCHWFPGSFVSILSWCLPSSCCMIKDYSSVSVGFYCMPLASNLRKQAGGNPGHSALVISLVFDVWGFANGVLHKGLQTVMPGQRIIHTVLQFTQSERVLSRSCMYNGHSTYLNTPFVTPFVTSTGLHFQFTCLLH